MKTDRNRIIILAFVAFINLLIPILFGNGIEQIAIHLIVSLSFVLMIVEIWRSGDRV